MIYMDYAASAPPYPQAVETMRRVMLEQFANPGALHRAGNESRRTLHLARKDLARLLNVREQEIFFTSGGTESNNWAALQGCAAGKKHIIAGATEHKSVLEPLRQLEKQGSRLTLIPPDRDGRIRVEAVERAVSRDTGLLCIQAVNNETGVIQDVDAFGTLARERGIPYFCDAVQSFGHVPQALDKAGIISLSAHKLGGPRGIGCLVIRCPHLIGPLIRGGGQERGRRSGTENGPGAAAFAQAAVLAIAELDEETLRLRHLTEGLAQKLKCLAPELVINGENAPRHPGILSCRFPGFTGEEMAIRLDRQGICVSPGAACSAGNGQPSHVLLAMGQSHRQAKEALRFSLGRLTTEEEVDAAVLAIGRILAQGPLL